MPKTLIIIILCIFLILGCVYVLLPSPLVYSVQPFSVDKDIYHTGDTMIITSYRCNNEPTPLVVITKERYFYNQQTGLRIDVPASPGVIQEGCSWQQAQVFDGFPPEMPSGYYMKRGITEAKGRYRTVEVPWQTETFVYIKD